MNRSAENELLIQILAADIDVDGADGSMAQEQEVPIWSQYASSQGAGALMQALNDAGN